MPSWPRGGVAVRRDLIVVGASAGGVEALRAFVAGLPADLPAAVLIVLHLPARGTSALAAILSRAGPLAARSAETGYPLCPGTVTVAPPDHHLLVLDGHSALSRGPTESGHRPAVDALFRSAARARGARVIAVVLSGALDDGAAGAVAVASRGGLVVVQDPAEALYPSMPRATMRLVMPDHVLAAGMMGRTLARRLREEVGAVAEDALPELDDREVDIALYGDRGPEHELTDLGTMSGYSCPDCNGALVALRGTDRFRCRVGHGWTAEALLDAQGDGVERALWASYRVLQERAGLARRMETAAAARKDWTMQHRHADAHREAITSARVLRDLLLAGLPEGRAGTGPRENRAGP
jgi:two-component system, chemotaxis family, protein-glutamate methylesterase/glutaminase